MAFLIVFTTVLLYTVNADQCQCKEPTCFGTQIPPAGIYKSVGSGTLVSNGLQKHPDVSAWYTDKPMYTDGFTGKTEYDVRVPDEWFDALQGTEFEYCSWKPQAFTSFQWLNQNLQQYRKGEKEWPVKLTFNDLGERMTLDKCMSKGTPMLWYCDNAGTQGYFTLGCPNARCFNKTGVAIVVTPGTCGIGKGMTHKDVKFGSHSGGLECCTNFGCTQETKASYYSPPFQTQQCDFSEINTATPHYLPKSIGFIRGSLSGHKTGDDFDGWSVYGIQNNDAEEEFIKCCGFLLGPGGLMFQIYLKEHGVGSGGADPKDVQDKINAVVAQINRVTAELKGEIDQVYRMALKNQVSTLKNTIRLSIVENYLNISSYVENEVIKKAEQELQKEGWCNVNTHCWCPPNNGTLPPIDQVPTVGPITAVGGSLWWTWVAFGLIALLIGLVAIGACLKPAMANGLGCPLCI